MARCRVDKSVERVDMGGFTFPLGVYPIEPMTPTPRPAPVTSAIRLLKSNIAHSSGKWPILALSSAHELKD